MAVSGCGTAFGATYVPMNHCLRRSARTPLLRAPHYRMPSLAFPKASLMGEGLPFRMTGRPALCLSPISTSLMSANHDGLSFSRLQLPEGGNNSYGFTLSPLSGGLRLSKRPSSVAPRASKEASISLENEKPQWWWRTAACLAYFLPLHETWNYGETAYFLQPYLERFDFLTNPVLEVPSWFSMLYFFVAFLWLVRKKELPHFLRCHIMMGMLLENALQIIWTVSRWMPLAIFGVKIGVYFWTAVSFAFFFCVLRCICSALAGNYAGIPCISDAAYMQIPRS